MPEECAPEMPMDVAGRIVLAVDRDLPAEAREACAELASALAARAGVPVTLATVPVQSLDAIRPLLRDGDGRVRELAPPRPVSAAPMAAAPFVWRGDGRPDWGAMWTTFCDLALYGGPPHRGADQALRGAPAGDAGAEPVAETLGEIQRGIWETTGLYAEPAGPGWLAVTCESGTMAAWLCAAIILENVDARVEEDRLLLPSGPDFKLEDQVKSVITVLAKTHHYWQAHVTGGDAG